MAPKRKPKPAQPAQPVASPMEAGGDSDNWVAQKANQIRIGTEFVEQIEHEGIKAQLPAGAASWQTLPVPVLITQLFWGLLATFLCNTYVISSGVRNAGKHLGIKSVLLACWSGLMHQAFQFCTSGVVTDDVKVRPSPRARIPCAHTAGARLLAQRGRRHVRSGLLQSIHRCVPPPFACAQAFFRCLDNDNSAQAKWLRGMKANMGRSVYQRCLVSGVKTDHSATPIYLAELRDLCAAFARANSREAAVRKLALKSLQRTCGRCPAIERGGVSVLRGPPVGLVRRGTGDGVPSSRKRRSRSTSR